MYFKIEVEIRLDKNLPSYFRGFVYFALVAFLPFPTYIPSLIPFVSCCTLRSMVHTQSSALTEMQEPIKN